MEISVKTQKWKFGDLCHVAGDLWEIHGNVSEMSRVLARKIFEKKRKKNQTAKKKMNQIRLQNEHIEKIDLDSSDDQFFFLA